MNIFISNNTLKTAILEEIYAIVEHREIPNHKENQQRNTSHQHYPHHSQRIGRLYMTSSRANALDGSINRSVLPSKSVE
jgi:hypothetical protein